MRLGSNSSQCERVLWVICHFRLLPELAGQSEMMVMHLFWDLQKEAMNGKENTFVIDCFVGKSFAMNVIFPCTPSGI